MKFIELNGAPLALLLALPNWAQPITVEMSLPASVDKGISARETRRVYADSMRYSLGYTVDIFSARGCTDLRLWLNRLKTEMVGVPMWPDQVEISAAVIAGATVLPKTADMPVRYGAEWIILSADGGTYEIVTVTAITDSQITIAAPGLTLPWSAGSFAFPLLFGKLAERPQFDAITDEALSGLIKVQENSPYARRLNPIAVALPTVGAGVPAFSSAKLFTPTPDWRRVLDRTEADEISKSLGFLREEQRYEYAQPVRRGLEMGFECWTREDIALIEAFFTNRRGTWGPFFAPTHRGDARLTQDLPIAGNPMHILIEQPSRFSDPDYAAHPGHPYIALVDINGEVYPQKITNISSGTITVAVDIATAHPAASTKLSHLLLARFAEAKLSWTYTTDGQATTRLRVIEVPDEYVTPNTEIPPRAFIYKWTEILPIFYVQWFTSYENSFVYSDGGGDHTCTPAPFSHRGDRSGIQLDREEIEVTSWGGNFPTNPLRKFFPYALEGDLFLDIVEVNAEDPNDESAKIIFAGRVIKPDMAGKDWKAVARRFGNFVDRNVCRYNFQKPCGVSLYSAKCGVDRDDHKTVAEIAVLDGELVDVTTAAAVDEDYWAGGFCETAPDADWEQRPILHSEPITGGYRLTLGRPLFKAEVGADLNIFPGCNFSIQMCHERFDNLARFRATPYIPNKNPSANIGEVNHNAGGKKG